MYVIEYSNGTETRFARCNGELLIFPSAESADKAAKRLGMIRKWEWFKIHSCS